MRKDLIPERSVVATNYGTSPSVRDYSLPTLIDLTGFENQDEEITKEVLRLIFYGKLRNASNLNSVYRFGKTFGVWALRLWYGVLCTENHFKVNRVVIVSSANEEVPEGLFNGVMEVVRPTDDVYNRGCILAMKSPFFFTDGGDWSAGTNFCEVNYGRMLTIDSQTKYDFVMAMDRQFHKSLILTNNIYIGLFTEKNDCTDYVWTDGKPLNWSKWDLSHNQPRDCASKQCIFLKYGLFRTGLCSENKIAACEYGEFLHNSSLFITSRIMPWRVGYMMCSWIGGRLVVIDDQKKQDQITLKIRDHSGANVSVDTHYWIGLITPTTSCDNLTWVDGTAVGWENFIQTSECGVTKCVVWNQQRNGWLTSVCDDYHEAICEYGYDHMENFFFGEGFKTASGADSQCKQNGGILATVDTTKQYIQALVMLSIHLYISAWVGLRADSYDCKNYKWTNGNPLGWVNWSPGEPNNCAKQFCVRLTENGLGTSHCYNYETVALCVKVNSTTTQSTNSVTARPAEKPTTTTEKPTTTTEKPTTTAEKPTTTDAITANVSCDCCTRTRTNVTQPSHAELLEVIIQLKAALSVNKNNTSTYRRKLVSVYESRPSSMVMGGVACIIMSVVISWVVVPDFLTLFVFLFKRASR
ncbi:secretory phospholipase A2 receptor-like [Mizuhopecten yessoensis]|uniref:secretory phospholipase A2 receptor-like n=1 Tax=Mizuhopecten yessoensis TaxID=6573 RepID=UPI000B45A8E1|nr:secretory phospholipase A2 receptor-like [Mizuhopecten yessoensis]